MLFDARHPEPGAMRDTLEHLVAGTVRRNDSNKVLFILNQIDTTAAEDNAEEVVAAWQRALAHGGLVSGRFYATYNEDAAVQIEDAASRERYQRKRDADLGEIYQRISEVSVERVYRIIGSLEYTANQIENNIVPAVKEATRSWVKKVLMLDAIIMFPIVIAIAIYLIKHLGAATAFDNYGTVGLLGAILLSFLLLYVIHLIIRAMVAKWVARSLPEKDAAGSIRLGFLRNTRWWQPLARPFIVGWNKHARAKIMQIREAADLFVQQLNDEYTNPSGKHK